MGVKSNHKPLFTVFVLHFLHGSCSSLDLQGGIKQSDRISNQFARRLLAEETNLRALFNDNSPHRNNFSETSTPPKPSGTIPVAPPPAKAHSETPPPITGPPPTLTNESVTEKHHGSSKWVYFVVVPVAILLVISVVLTILVCQRKGVTPIGPWRTGLSGQLQKAFVTGVPKLNRAELECACEDFSNIIAVHPEFSVFKGTLSSGVEISVAATAVKSARDWSKHSEMRFRKKIETLTRINHKNFINLLGYCEEEEPFTRMIVFEYAPNGALFEHLHVEGNDPIDWSGRMRIVMGIAYCLQHLHELDPSIALPGILSSSVFLSEDYAAKVGDAGIWREVIGKEKTIEDHNFEISESNSKEIDPASNIYSFGILLLEIITGRLLYSQEGSLLRLASECMKENNRSITQLIDPTLKSHKPEELDTICEIIRDCLQIDPEKRPKMREITTKLRDVIGISPETASPRLSPLWWAELEILSV